MELQDRDYRVMYVEVDDAIKNLRQRMKAAVEKKGLGRTHMEHVMAVVKQTMMRYGIDMVPAGERPNHKSGEMKPVWAVIKSEDSVLDQNAILKGLEALDIEEDEVDLTPRTIVRSALAAGLMEPSRKVTDNESLRLVERKPKGVELTEHAPPELAELLTQVCRDLTVIADTHKEFEHDLGELKKMAEEAGNGVRGLIARNKSSRTDAFPVTLDGLTRYYVIEHDESTKLGAPKPLPLEETKKLLRGALRETVRSLTSSGYDVNDGELLCVIMRKHRDVLMTTLKEMLPPPKEVDVDKLVIRDATRDELLGVAPAYGDEDDENEGENSGNDDEDDRGSDNDDDDDDDEGRGGEEATSRVSRVSHGSRGSRGSRGSHEERRRRHRSGGHGSGRGGSADRTRFRRSRPSSSRGESRLRSGRGGSRSLLAAGSPAESIMSSISARLERQLREKLAEEGKKYMPASSAASTVKTIEQRIQEDRRGLKRGKGSVAGAGSSVSVSSQRRRVG